MTLSESLTVLALARFGARCLDEHRSEMADLDGGWLQDEANGAGLLHHVRLKEPCRDCEDADSCMGIDGQYHCLQVRPEVQSAMEELLR